MGIVQQGLNFIAEYWWVWVSVFIVFGTLSILGWIEHRKRQQELKAQFIVTGTVLIGCIFFLFNIVGIIAAVMSIISAILNIFTWVVTK